jgi:DNA-binding GntR family transcriptional regulator
MKPSLLLKLEQLAQRLEEVGALLNQEGATADMDQYRKLTRELSLFRRRNFSDHALLVTSVNEHRDILDAIGSRNAAKSAEALRQHVLMSRERTIRNYVKYSERKAP